MEYVISTNICYIGLLFLILISNTKHSKYQLPISNIFNKLLITSILYIILNIIANITQYKNIIFSDSLILVYIIANYTLYLYFYKLINCKKLIEDSLLQFIMFVPLFFFFMLNINSIYIERYYFIWFYLISFLSFFDIRINYQGLDLLKFSVFPFISLIIFLVDIANGNIIINPSGLIISTIILYFYQLKNMISIDPLTKVNNRNNMEELIKSRITNSKIRKNKLYLLMIDADNFKYVNDVHGHAEGDKCLVDIAESIADATLNLKYKPFIARYGGDEFILVAEVEDEAEIIVLTTKIQSSLMRKNKLRKSDCFVTIGKSIYNEEAHHNIMSLIIDADADLYKNKNCKKQ